MGKKNKRPNGAPTPEQEADKSKALDAALELESVAEKAPEAPEQPEQPKAPTQELAKSENPKPSASRTKDEVVKGKDGKPRFIKKAPTLDPQGRNPIAKPKKADKRQPRRRMPAHSTDGAHANPAYLKFPADRWGLTKDLKRAIISTASRIAGDEEKMALVKETLKIALTHMNTKFERDAEYKAARKAEAEAARAEKAK